MKKPDSLFWKRFIYMVIGVIVIAVGVTLLRFSSFGTDPFNCMNLGVSSHLPISYGTYQLLFNVVLFIPLFILKPKILGIGAVANMFLTAYMVDGGTFLLGKIGITIENVSQNMPARIAFLISGILVLCIGIALYMECNMGVAAYDALSEVIDERSHGKLQFRWVRIVTDVLCIGIGILSGSVVGVGTVVVAFFTGPLVSAFRRPLAANLAKKPKSKSIKEE